MTLAFPHLSMQQRSVPLVESIGAKQTKLFSNSNHASPATLLWPPSLAVILGRFRYQKRWSRIVKAWASLRTLFFNDPSRLGDRFRLSCESLFEPTFPVQLRYCRP